MATRYSHSRLATFETCPRQYDYRYIQRLPRLGPGVEAHMGTSVHAALEHLNRELRSRASPPSRDDVLAAYEQAWRKVPAADLRVVKRGFTVEDYHRLGRHCVTSHYDAGFPFADAEVIDVERKVLIELDTRGRYGLVGYIDRLSRGPDGVLEIQDYKTSGSLPRARDLEEDRQLALYEMGLRGGSEPLLSEGEPARHVWHYLAFGERFERTLSRQSLREMARGVRSLIDRVEAAVSRAAAEGGELPARPGVLCHWCDFSEHCPEGRAERERRGAPGLPQAAG